MNPSGPHASATPCPSDRPLGVDLSLAENPPLADNRPAGWRVAWYVVSTVLFESAIHLPYSWKAAILRLFGARIGRGLVIKPRVKIKFPWFLSIGNHTWLGERVWIDNLAPVQIGNNVCISQDALMLTGNHDYRSPSFTRFVRSVLIEDGVWIGARCIVCPGTVIRSGAIIEVGSVVKGSLAAHSVFGGRAADFRRHRDFRVKLV